MNELLLVVCVAAVVGVITGVAVSKIQKSKAEANKTLSITDIMQYGAEISYRIAIVVQEFTHITSEEYETDAVMRQHLIGRATEIIYSVLKENCVTMPVDVEVAKTIATLLVEKAISAYEANVNNEKVQALQCDIEEMSSKLEDKPAGEDNADVEKVDLGDF